jgi:hypothetical protein
MNKKEDILDLIIKEYEKRNCLIKAGDGKKNLGENAGKINDLIDRYIDECVGKVRK